MKRALQKHRRIFATGILFAFVVAWVAPVQACFVSTTSTSTTVQSSCPDCASPYSCYMGHCGSSVSASCGASMLPAITISAQSLDKAVPPPALLDGAIVKPVRVTYKSSYLPDPPSAQSAPSVNIRFCTFLE